MSSKGRKFLLVNDFMMFKRNKVLLIAATVLLCVGIGLFFWVPRHLADQTQDYVLRKTGQKLRVGDGTQLTFSPHMGLTLNVVSLQSDTENSGLKLSAKSAHVDLSVWDVVSLRVDPKMITLNQADIILQTSNNTKTNLDLAPPNDAETATESERIQFNIVDGQLSTKRGDDQKQLVAQQINGKITLTNYGAITADGTARISNHGANFSIDLVSLVRLTEGGSPVDITVASGSNQLNFSGLAKMSTDFELAGQADVGLAFGDGLLRNVAPFGLGKNLKLAGGLRSTGGDFTMTNAKITSDLVQANGAISLALNGEKPKLSAELKSTQVNFSSPTKPQFTTAESWSEKPFNGDTLPEFDSDITLMADQVLGYGMNFGQGQFALSRQNDTINTKVNLAGGTIIGTFTTQTAYASWQHEFVLAARDVNLSELNPAVFRAGLGTMNGKLNAVGNSAADIIATLVGGVSTSVTDANAIGISAEAIVRKVSQAVVKGWPSEAKAELDLQSGTANFLVRDGIATTQDLQLDGRNFRVIGTGDIDLLRQALDFRVDPVLRDGDAVVVKLPVNIVVSGPWAAPQFYPDIEGILTNPTAAYDALKDMGLPNDTKKQTEKTVKKAKKLIDKVIGN